MADDPFAPSSDPDIPTPSRSDLLPLVYGPVRDQLAAGILDTRHAQNLWTGARRDWDEGHKKDAVARRAEEEAKQPSGTPTKANPGTHETPDAGRREPNPKPRKGVELSKLIEAFGDEPDDPSPDLTTPLPDPAERLREENERLAQQFRDVAQKLAEFPPMPEMPAMGELFKNPFTGETSIKYHPPDADDDYTSPSAYLEELNMALEAKREAEEEARLAGIERAVSKALRKENERARSEREMRGTDKRLGFTPLDEMLLRSATAASDEKPKQNTSKESAQPSRSLALLRSLFNKIPGPPWLKWAEISGGLAVGAAGLKEYLVAELFLLVCLGCGIAQTYVWTVPVKNFLLRWVARVLLGLITAAIFVIAGLTVMKVKGTDEWSNWLKKDAPISIPSPLPVSKPEFRGEIEQAIFGMSGKTLEDTGIGLVVSIRNSGAPSIAEYWSFIVDTPDGARREGFMPYFKREIAIPLAHYPNNTVVFHAEDLLYKKTATPITTGAEVRGVLVFVVKGVPRDIVYQKGTKLELSFADVTGKRYTVTQEVRTGITTQLGMSPGVNIELRETEKPRGKAKK